MEWVKSLLHAIVCGCIFFPNLTCIFYLFIHLDYDFCLFYSYYLHRLYIYIYIHNIHIHTHFECIVS